MTGILPPGPPDGWPQQTTWEHRGRIPHVVILGAGASKAACPNGDKHGRILPVMNELYDEVLANRKLTPADEALARSDFEAWFCDLTDEVSMEIESEVYSYFEQIVIPEDATVYDRLILGLRPKDLIASFNWDPLLIQAYDRNADVCDPPRLLFLHGNVALGQCDADEQIGPRDSKCPRCGSQLVPLKLLYPIRKKNYAQQSFGIRAAWDGLRGALSDAYLFTVFGYSAPTTDVEAIELMRSVWDKAYARDLADVELITKDNRADAKRRWDKFIVRDHCKVRDALGDTEISRFPRRSCEQFADASLGNRPWSEDPLPKTSNLRRLQDWIKPLVDQERRSEPPFGPLEKPKCPPHGD